MSQAVRNIAILAHVDAGKTTLSERILFAAGEVRRPGKVEEGLATMDYMPEEKERGITIESGVAHFEWKDTWFNLSIPRAMWISVPRWTWRFRRWKAPCLW